MSSDSIITLYDVPSDFSGKAWSSNGSEQYALNYKGAPYKTVWIEYPEIEPTMRSIGAAPTKKKPDGSPWYTIPVIVDPSRTATSGGPTVVSDSFHIAEYLDETYSTPSTGPLFPPGTKALQQLFYDHFFTNVLLQSVPMALPEASLTVIKGIGDSPANLLSAGNLKTSALKALRSGMGCGMI
ncbi:hypothetical protein JB92DRAFT_2980192 [Gautieria morchelliformis]|nr:hypothetical protein JB92DRAFT_2980192 [Gautieria morchelliformis]